MAQEIHTGDVVKEEYTGVAQGWGLTCDSNEPR